MKNLLLIISFLMMGINAHAGIDKGNGGSGSESKIAGQQAQLEAVALKLRLFFLKNEAILKTEFPEFDIPTLITKMSTSDIRVVDEDNLIDKNDVSRTCLNFPDASLIQCKSSGIEPLLNQPVALFVLVFHEYLGLIGAEETSPTDPSVVAGYAISKRIAPYVTKVNGYDLVISDVGAPPTNPNTKYREVAYNSLIDVNSIGPCLSKSWEHNRRTWYSASYIYIQTNFIKSWRLDANDNVIYKSLNNTVTKSSGIEKTRGAHKSEESALNECALEHIVTQKEASTSEEIKIETKRFLKN